MNDRLQAWMRTSLLALAAMALTACTAEPVQEPATNLAVGAEEVTADETDTAAGESETPCALVPTAAKTVWGVGLVSFKSEARARRAQARLVAQGYAAELFLISTQTPPWYRVAVSGFKTETDARKFRDSARAMGYKTAWLLRPS